MRHNVDERNGCGNWYTSMGQLSVVDLSNAVHLLDDSEVEDIRRRRRTQRPAVHVAPAVHLTLMMSSE